MLVFGPNRIYAQNSTNFQLGGNDRFLMAIDGAGSLSHDWFNFLNVLRFQKGYKFSNLNDIFTYPYSSPISNGATYISNRINNPPNGLMDVNNVLGIGHDIGGLALRGAQVMNSDLSALILVGTPNNGSSLLRDLLRPQNSWDFEEWLNSLERFKGKIDCPDCDKITSMRTLLKKLATQALPLSGAAKGDNRGYYNGLQIPTNTAVLWGNAGINDLNQFIGAAAGPTSSSSIDLAACARREKTVNQILLKNAYLEKKIKTVTGFWSNITKYVDGIIKAGTKPWELAKTIGDFISSSSEQALEAIKLQEGISELEREALICSLTDSRLESEWRLRIASNELSAANVPNPNFSPSECQYWTNQYSILPAAYHFMIDMRIEIYCPEYEVTFHVEPHDLVYTRSEQVIPEIDLTYEIKANHFQEQDWGFNGSVLEPLFNGSQGAAFKIPK